MRRAIAMSLLALGALPLPAGAPHAPAPPDAAEALRLLYSGETDQAVAKAREVQRAQPEHPLGYLLEANAAWWKIYCAACEVKWGMIDAWKRGKAPEDGRYLALVDKGVALAEASLKQADSAEMRLYAGMGWALRARLHGLRDERLATARTGVRARAHFLRALELDPALADAQTGLGLYNYYADALSVFARVLRFFLGIPGGNKKLGTQQLQAGIARGELTRVEARFYLAKCLRNYDQQYERAVEVLEPLVEEFPRNPVFHLLLGDLYAQLRRNDRAAASFRAAQQLPVADTVCAARVRQVARVALDALGAAPARAAAAP
jgi:tetratricopeptide (TPR) repeat protein